MRDDKTSRGWPLPYKTNTLADDVERIRTAFNSIDAELSTLEENISQNLIENLDQKLADLEAKLEAQDFRANYGFYIDDDGDLCQHLESTSGGDTNPDDGGQSGGETETPSVLINGEPATLTTQEDIKELLDELDFGQ